MSISASVDLKVGHSTCGIRNDLNVVTQLINVLLYRWGINTVLELKKINCPLKKKKQEDVTTLPAQCRLCWEIDIWRFWARYWFRGNLFLSSVFSKILGLTIMRYCLIYIWYISCDVLEIQNFADLAQIIVNFISDPVPLRWNLGSD